MACRKKREALELEHAEELLLLFKRVAEDLRIAECLAVPDKQRCTVFAPIR